MGAPAWGVGQKFPPLLQLWIGWVGLQSRTPLFTYRVNLKDLRKYLIPGTGCCCPQEKKVKGKQLIFGIMAYAKMGST